MWTDSDQTEVTGSRGSDFSTESENASRSSAATPEAVPSRSGPSVSQSSQPSWCIPSTISADPDEARASISLPEFDALVLSKAEAVAEYFPFAVSEYRGLRSKGRDKDQDSPHFEKVFRIAASIANIAVHDALDYDELLIVTAWHCVRRQEEGFLGSYPKSLLCPLSHAATPTAVNSLSVAQRVTFERRVSVYLRYLLCDKFELRTCADIENADLRQLLRSAGFRLIRPSAVPEVAFPGITRGEDPPVRPWKLSLRQELSDERATQMLVNAALWQIKYGLRLVVVEDGQPRWNIGAFARANWEDAFLSLGVRVPPSLMRQSGLLDWRTVLARCLQQIGAGNLPPELLGKVAALPPRVQHDDQRAVWEVLDRASQSVLEQVRISEPHLFTATGRMNHRSARAFRRWARLFDEVSPNILSRFGVSAFTALHRVAPENFGWGAEQLKPWELEQEHGKWKGPRGRALLKSAYAFALSEAGLGSIEYQNEQVVWHCTRTEFLEWSAGRVEREISPYDFLYRLASRHGLTPLLNREISHTAAISLLAGMNLHQNLPKIEGCWDVCMRTALERHGGKLEVRLTLPDLVPLPLRLRKAVLAPLKYSYLHKEIRLVRDFDRRMARESHRRLEDIPGWWDDERILGTPLVKRVNNSADSTRTVLELLRPEPWLELPAQKIRFRALHLLISSSATSNGGSLSSEEICVLLRFALSGIEHTNIAHVSLLAIRRGFERILARDDTRAMLDSLLLHVGTAYETEIWGQVRKFIVLDAINDLLGLVVRNSLLHLMSED